LRSSSHLTCSDAPFGTIVLLTALIDRKLLAESAATESVAMHARVHLAAVRKLTEGAIYAGIGVF